jgi:hypothetical protein
MNLSRGLLRAWILISVLWIAGAGFTAYTIVAPEALHGRFQPRVEMKKGTTAEQVEKIDFSKPFYDFVVSPSRSFLTIVFSLDQITAQELAQFILVDFPDGSSLYLPAGYNGADRAYISQQFWDQRWSRWGHAAGVVALWAFLPCTLIFVLGFGILWVGRGFKRA